MQIVERLYVECPGGVQLTFSVVQSGHTEPYAKTSNEIAEIVFCVFLVGFVIGLTIKEIVLGLIRFIAYSDEEA